MPVSWKDGSALVYSNWESRARVSVGRKPMGCPVMTGQEGKWNFVDCKYAYSRVICKTEASEYQGCRLKKKGFLIPALRPLLVSGEVIIISSWELICSSAFPFTNL